MLKTGLNIDAALLDQILAEAADDPGVEICGLLVGERRAVRAIYPCDNVADHPATAFEIDPVQLIAMHKQARIEGAKVIGHYHSHPNGREEPSDRDREMIGVPGEIWIILANGRARAFIVNLDCDGFVETALNRVKSASEPRQ